MWRKLSGPGIATNDQPGPTDAERERTRQLTDTLNPEALSAQERYALVLQSAAQSNKAARTTGTFAATWATMDHAETRKQAMKGVPRPKRETKLTQHQIDILTAITKGASGTLDIAAHCTGTVSQVNARADWLAEKGLIRILVGTQGKVKRRFYYITDAGKAALEKEGKI